MPIRLGAMCRNCGKPIFLRNRAQGWLHSTEDRKCSPTYAEPVKDPLKGADPPA